MQASHGVPLKLAVMAVASLVAANLRAQTPERPSPVVCADGLKLLPLTGELGSSARASSYTAVRGVLGEIQTQAYPELAAKEIQLRTFQSKSDYFRTRFSLSRFFLLRRMHYFVEVNPGLFARKPPADGVCAILGHEMAHVADLSHGNRIRLFRLVRLLSNSYTVRFERRADLEAIRRGFGDGLIDYRNWVYRNIPPVKVEEKKRNYFSPEEIVTIQRLTQSEPQLFDDWKRKVPLSEGEITASVDAKSGQKPHH